MRTGSAVCLGVTALSLATIVGVPTALSVRCHTHPKGTKALAQDAKSAAKAEMPCPYELHENGDVVGGILHREKQGHIFPNGTALDKDGLFMGQAKENGLLYLAYPGVDNIDAFINSTEGKPASEDAQIGVRAKGVVDGKGDVYKEVTNCNKWGKDCVTKPDKRAHLTQKSDNLPKEQKNALGLFFLA